MIAPMYLMCAPQDISVVYHVKDTFTGGPTIYLFADGAEVDSMQTHRRRSRMKKEYGDDAERQMLREDILAEFERRLELDI